MKYYTIKEAAQHVGKSEKTVRRWIKGGHLKAKKENGQFLISQRSLASQIGHQSGQMSKEMSKKAGQKVDTDWTDVQSDNLPNSSEINQTLLDILGELRSSRDNAIVAYDENPLVAELREERNQLREESLKMANLLGQAQNKVQQLEQEIKMLQAPREEEEKEREEELNRLIAQKEKEKVKAVTDLRAKADKIVQLSKQEVTETRDKIAQKEKQIKELKQFLEEERSLTWWDRLWGR